MGVLRPTLSPNDLTDDEVHDALRTVIGLALSVDDENVGLSTMSALVEGMSPQQVLVALTQATVMLGTYLDRAFLEKAAARMAERTHFPSA